MQEVARLEAQFEAADLKPQTKSQKRPKDTVMRDQKNSLSNVNAPRMKNVDAKQLTEAVQLLKLLLQQQQLSQENLESIAPLLFDEGQYDPDSYISIQELHEKFENLGIQAKKSLQVARFLVEPVSDEEYIVNENMKAESQEVLSKLQQLIGQYYLYIQEEVTGYNDDPNVIQEEYMQKLVFENFSRFRETLIESLKCEDYEEEGLLELS